MICAHCGDATTDRPCAACGKEPLALGRYALDSVVGRGASGTTFKATTPAGDVVAVKEMALGRAAPGKERELLQREARVLAQLDHRGIPRFYESGVEGHGPGRVLRLVQDYVEGVDLQAELATHRYSLTEVLVILDGVLDVLGYLHGLSPPVVHRDIKPGNVMRRPDGSIVLVDFGAVRDSLRELGGSTVAGTFGYMAPEQLIGDASPVSDLYAVGALAVHLLSRVDPQQMLSVKRGLGWTDHVQVPPGVHELLDDLLQPDPDERARRCGDTGSVRERVQALCLDPDAAAGTAPTQVRHPIAAVPGPPLARPVSASSRGRLIAIVVACSAVAGVAANAFLLDATKPAKIAVPAEVAPAPSPEAVPVVVPADIPEPPDPPAPEVVAEVGVGDLPARGAADAPVEIVAFSDLQCPYCARANGTLLELLETREGQIRIHFRDFPLDMHRQARGAHVAARCADEQGAFHEMQDWLHEHHKQLGRAQLSAHAASLALDIGAFERCMEVSWATHEASIERDIAAGQELGVRGTPTFFVHGEVLRGAQPRAAFDAAIDRALQRADR